GYVLVEVPEATGVQVFETCELAGIFLERNPQKIVWKAMIIGRKKAQMVHLLDLGSCGNGKRELAIDRKARLGQV
ncbi:hypothetical protein MUP37_05465, partial [Candidatus Bathyarchaeota archaeon]|nr:hypothetical protein [Candidatus Bathyarchaeota archaeon]